MLMASCVHTFRHMVDTGQWTPVNKPLATPLIQSTKPLLLKPIVVLTLSFVALTTRTPGWKLFRMCHGLFQTFWNKKYAVGCFPPRACDFSKCFEIIKYFFSPQRGRQLPCAFQYWLLPQRDLLRFFQGNRNGPKYQWAKISMGQNQIDGPKHKWPFTSFKEGQATSYPSFNASFRSCNSFKSTDGFSRYYHYHYSFK